MQFTEEIASLLHHISHSLLNKGQLLLTLVKNVKNSDGTFQTWIQREYFTLKSNDWITTVNEDKQTIKQQDHPCPWGLSERDIFQWTQWLNLVTVVLKLRAHWKRKLSMNSSRGVTIPSMSRFNTFHDTELTIQCHCDTPRHMIKG